MEEQRYPRTFHTASVIHGGGESVVLCHAHHPWIAFTEDRGNGFMHDFVPPPPWSHVFRSSGFVVLTAGQLTTPLFGVDTSALSREEWRQIRYYAAETLGAVVFNTWD
ncbi:hypothetical protein [Streptomyces sp. ISL-11]|uniref:hypothetical protein n=1 Tax=Streptomyces sp. ISL-11 TaxID=2819174 RepID=UPI0020359054|nr:hypothetical protein [Streptomyces sp. ISL-11]